MLPFIVVCVVLKVIVFLESLLDFKYFCLLVVYSFFRSFGHVIFFRKIDRQDLDLINKDSIIVSLQQQLQASEYSTSQQQLKLNQLSTALATESQKCLNMERENDKLSQLNLQQNLVSKVLEEKYNNALVSLDEHVQQSGKQEDMIRVSLLDNSNYHQEYTIIVVCV